MFLFDRWVYKSTSHTRHKPPGDSWRRKHFRYIQRKTPIFIQTDYFRYWNRKDAWILINTKWLELDIPKIDVKNMVQFDVCMILLFPKGYHLSININKYTVYFSVREMLYIDRSCMTRARESFVVAWRVFRLRKGYINLFFNVCVLCRERKKVWG